MYFLIKSSSQIYEISIIMKLEFNHLFKVINKKGANLDFELKYLVQSLLYSKQQMIDVTIIIFIFIIFIFIKVK